MPCMRRSIVADEEKYLIDSIIGIFSVVRLEKSEKLFVLKETALPKGIQ